MMMSKVTEKPLHWELCWHLVGEAWWSQTNFDCTILGRVGETMLGFQKGICVII